MRMRRAVLPAPPAHRTCATVAAPKSAGFLLLGGASGETPPCCKILRSGPFADGRFRGVDLGPATGDFIADRWSGKALPAQHEEQCRHHDGDDDCRPQAELALRIVPEP